MCGSSILHAGAARGFLATVLASYLDAHLAWILVAWKHAILDPACRPRSALGAPVLKVSGSPFGAAG